MPARSAKQTRPAAAHLPRRQALHERVARAILDEAATVLAKRGERVNLTDVAVAAGVARATVYRYFPNRRHLLDELTRVAAENASERLAAARIEEVAVEEGLSRAVRAFVDVGDAFVVLADERRGPGAEDFDRLVAAPVRRLLEAGRSAGAIRADVPIKLLAESLIGLVASVQRHGSLGRDDTVATAVGVFMHGAATADRP